MVRPAKSSTTLYINTLTNPNFQKLLEFDGAHVHTQDTGIIHRDGTFTVFHAFRALGLILFRIRNLGAGVRQ